MLLNVEILENLLESIGFIGMLREEGLQHFCKLPFVRRLPLFFPFAIVVLF
jgi:hypothetical protein